MGAATTCYVALHPKVKGVTGEYFCDSNIGSRSSLATDAELAKKLWDFSLNLTQPNLKSYNRDHCILANDALSAPIEALIDSAGDDTWPSIKKLLQRESEKVVSGFSTALTAFHLDEEEKDKMLSGLKDHARGVVEGKTREEAGRVIVRMKDRFTTLFSHDSDSMLRVWIGNEDIRAITKTARSALLSVMAVIHLGDVTDNIERTLELALADTKAASKALNDALASSSWEKVPASRTLITHVQCKSLWRQFKTETEYTVTPAISAQA